ncbi:hypothetical protein FG386_000019 [Cryptosporidium ryanae]|uniref:uncharacterized protein n=1 Tax=Cryptosporidium ryanae TaxID=515981 RepID=UPI003519E662|nr:hypothetical protein FG386_000019 [Cryptosporidium ryanae]
MENKKTECIKSNTRYISSIPKFEIGDRVGKYVKIREVGTGSYGKAIHVKDISRGRDYVMKSIDISKLSENERKDAINEVKLLSSIRHPYIICFRESFVDGNHLNIVMEYAEGGDLFKRVNNRKKFKDFFLEKQIVRWLTQALLGLSHLHNRKILHRDIKSQNMFISNNGLKIGDFGIAKVLENTGAFAKTTIGTPYYLSPEICLSKPYSWSSDIWALGCVAYEMCTLRVPFDAPNLKVLVEKITQGKLIPIQNSYSECLREIIMDMLVTNSSQRPTVNELLNYPIIMAELKQMRKEALYICKNNSYEKSIINNAVVVMEIISTLQKKTISEKHLENSIEQIENPTKTLSIGNREVNEVKDDKIESEENTRTDDQVVVLKTAQNFTSNSLEKIIAKYKCIQINDICKETEMVSEASTDTWTTSSTSHKNNTEHHLTSPEEKETKNSCLISKIKYKNMSLFPVETLLQ